MLFVCSITCACNKKYCEVDVLVCVLCGTSIIEQEKSLECIWKWKPQHNNVSDETLTHRQNLKAEFQICLIRNLDQSHKQCLRKCLSIEPSPFFTLLFGHAAPKTSYMPGDQQLICITRSIVLRDNLISTVSVPWTLPAFTKCESNQGKLAVFMVAIRTKQVLAAMV